MKKIIVLFSFLVLSITSFSHFIWMETRQKGEQNKEQEIKIFFGEFSYGKYEEAKSKSFSKIKDFSLIVHHPNGDKTSLKVEPNGNNYLAKFTPTTKGTYTVILNHDKIPVYDLTKYGHGIFKANYHATTKIQVGDQIEHSVTDNPKSITIKNISDIKDEYRLQVWYKGEVLKDTEVSILAPDNWIKKLKTDENGTVSFTLPWKSKFVIEAVFKHEEKGVYLNTEYNYIWHCCTLTIQN